MLRIIAALAVASRGLSGYTIHNQLNGMSNRSEILKSVFSPQLEDAE